MRSIWVIAVNTYQEIIRDRILYGLLVFALLLIGLSLALGSLSFAEQERISVNFGFAAIHISSVFIAIFLGSTLVAREIDKQTVLTLLVRPISRTQFILGKYLGLLFVILTAMLGLALVLTIVSVNLGSKLNSMYFLALYGIMLEAMIVLALAMFFSTFTKPVLVVSFTIGFFLIGHWIENLKFIIQKSESSVAKSLGGAFSEVFINLEKFNWRSLFIYSETISSKYVFSSTLYAAGWMCVFLTIASIVISKRDFV